MMNIDIEIAVMDVMLVHNVYDQMMSGVKLMLFLVQIIMYHFIVKDTLVLGEGPTNVFNIITTAAVKYSAKSTKVRNEVWF